MSFSGNLARLQEASPMKLASAGLSSLLVWVRVTIPMICLATLWSTAGHDLFALVLLFISAVDVAAVGLGPRSFLRLNLLDARYAVVRDAIYALAFYMVFINTPGIPALALAPSVLIESYVVFGSQIFIRAVMVELLLTTVRMAVMFFRFQQGWRPYWAIGIGVATIMAGLLGMEITRLQQLRSDIILERRRLKETLTEMLTTTLSPSGIGAGVLSQKGVDQMLDEFCQVADRAKGREIGLTLAKVIASKLEASSLLTSREFEVLSLVAEGKSYRQIAQILYVSSGTVRAHVAGIMRKANVHSRDEMVDWAKKHHLLPADQNDEPSFADT